MDKVINNAIYAMLLGYFVMKQYPPKIVLWYVMKYPPITDNKDLWVILTSIRNAPNMVDEVLFKLTMKSIK